MTYNQDCCFSDDYFMCPTTSIPESESESDQDEVLSHDLPLDVSSYQSVVESPPKEDVPPGTLPLSTSDYRKSSVKKISYRVIRK